VSRAAHVTSSVLNSNSIMLLHMILGHLTMLLEGKILLALKRGHQMEYKWSGLDCGMDWLSYCCDLHSDLHRQQYTGITNDPCSIR
jgi:hypothetical protein